MTVSHLYYDYRVVDASVNYQQYKQDGTPIEYDPDDPGFVTLM
jgi:hypothetical protein